MGELAGMQLVARHNISDDEWAETNDPSRTPEFRAKADQMIAHQEMKKKLGVGGAHVICAQCGFNLTSTSGKKCSRCNTAYYCSRECQKKHWKMHKKECTPCKENA
jgi:hypothetical protein